LSFKVIVEPGNRVFEVEPGESILQAAMHNGVHLPYGCRNAVCGTCKGTVIEGNIDYGDYEPLGLTTDEIRQGMALFCRAMPMSDVRIKARIIDSPENITIKNMPTRVAKKELLSDDVIRLYLKAPGGTRMQFLAGQYIDILLQNGQRRSFSIANSPHDDEFIELHIRHVEDGAFSSYLFNSLQLKDILRIEGPFGQFYLRDPVKTPIIFMAGGTGFAPIKGIIEYAFQEDVRQPMYLYWGARTRSDLYMDDLARQWSQRPGFHYIPVLSDVPAGDRWHGRRGMVHEMIAQDFASLEDYAVYTAGPPLMIKAGWEAFKRLGLPADRFYSDAFTFAHDELEGQDS
jgi:CDP-4-dehydro-6-deoxyglucose reductase